MALSKSPGDDYEPTPESKQLSAYLSPDCYSRHLGDTPSKDAKFEPELQNLLKKLYDRQRQEADNFREDARNRLSPDGEKPEVLKTYNDEFRKQYTRFADERERYIRDYQHARALDQTPAPLQNRANTKGTAMPADDREFTAKVPFTQDPEFIKLQRDLQLRQEQERKALENKQTEQRIEFGRQAGVTREQLEQNYKRQLQERETLSRKHKVEDNRYTRDYHDAKVLREDLREKEKTEALERGQDGPKRTR